MTHRPRFLLATGLVVLLAAFSVPANAQYFGRNKVMYEKFDFRVLKTPHFDVHYYPEDNPVSKDAALMAERWYSRLSRVFDHTFADQKPIILYSNHADFQQTNVSEGFISEGTGGFTESLKNRVVMPMTGDYAGLDHVLGHELVHAFQFDLAQSTVDSLPFRANQLPLWMMEGMAEYLSVGRNDAHTAMWMRDALLQDDFPTIQQLSTDSRFFPYRFGEALFAYIGGKWGDEKIADFYRYAGRRGSEYAFAKTLGVSGDSLSREWAEATREAYMPAMEGRTRPKEIEGVLLSSDRHTGDINLAPSVSPDGKRVAFLSEKDLFSIALFVADAESGEIERRLVSSGTDPHFDALRFIDSAGSWSPDGQRFAFVVFAKGNNEIVIVNDHGKVRERLRIKGVGAISNPAWSPDGEWIAFSGDAQGISNLSMIHIESQEVHRLTNDRYAALQPAWSPDGKKLAFVTDRGPEGNLEHLKFEPFRLAILDIETGEQELIAPFGKAKHINPQFSPDGTSLYFISDREGFSDIYRLDLVTGALFQITNVATGVSGITSHSPAMSVAQNTGRILYSIYTEGKYNVVSIEADSVGGKRLLPFVPLDDSARYLPPAHPEDPIVDDYLADADTGLPYNDDFEVENYKPKIQLDYVGTPTAGLAVDRFGASLVGGVSAFFSDMLGNHVVGAGLMANGGIKDVGGQVFYQNRGQRTNWGGTLGHVPFLSYFTTYQDTTLTDENGDPVDAYLVRQVQERIFVESGRLFAFHPFSTTRRFEVSGGFSYISYDWAVQSELNVDGFVVQRYDENIPSPSPLSLFQGALAYVHDSSFFGFTSPIRGTRYRMEVGPTLGSMDYYSALVDYRKYFFPKPMTVAFRGMHLGRYGRDSENPLLTELFIGYSTLIRGYTSGSFDLSECGRGSTGGDCPAFDRLIGSKFLVSNLEARYPLIGVEDFGLINFPYLPTELVAFADMGAAWLENDPVRWTFSRNSADRVPVFSAGVSGRFNLLGALILEVYYAYPFQRPEKGFHWGLQLAPGW